ncbi:MAG: toll/interleukin-1 receptor domain-containing protein, partial [Acidimicrobiia bacterium]
QSGGARTMKSWLARTSKPMPQPDELAHIHYRTWSDQMSVNDRVFLVDHADPTMLHAWGTVTSVNFIERIPVGDDEEANSPPYSTYADIHVMVVCRSLLILPLGLADFLTTEDFAAFSDGYWVEEEGLVTALPVELGAKISQALGIDEPSRPVFLSYAREDEDTAMRLYEKLSDAGVVVWLDRVALIPGQVWKQEVARAIQRSKHP